MKAQASPARATANRENARLPMGPRTPEGKVQSSRNAITHGLTARPDLLLPGEDVETYDAFRAGLLATLAPEGELEQFHAQRAAWLAWRLSRVTRIEAAVLAQAQATEERSDARDDIEEARDRTLFTSPEAVARGLTNGWGPPEPLAYARRLRDDLAARAPEHAAAAKLTAAQRRRAAAKQATGRFVVKYVDQGAQALVDGATRFDAAQARLRADAALSGRAFASAAERGLWDCLGRYERGISREFQRAVEALRVEQRRRPNGTGAGRPDSCETNPTAPPAPVAAGDRR